MLWRLVSFAVIWLSVATNLYAASGPSTWPNVPTPSAASVFWIAENVEQDGVPMQIQGFSTTKPMVDVKLFYRQWLRNYLGYGETQVGAATVLGARLGSVHVAVQLTSDEQSRVHGVITKAYIYSDDPQLLQRIKSSGQNVTAPPGSEVVSDTKSQDGDKFNRTVIFVNTISVETNVLYLREQLILKGWTRMSDKTVEGGVSSALVFRRGADELVASVVQTDTGTYVVLSETRFGN